MQTYTRLVKYIYDSYKSGAYLRCQSYSLGLPSRQCTCRTAQCKIIQTYVYQKSYSGIYFFQYPVCYHTFFFRKLKVIKELFYFRDAHFRYFRDVFSAYSNGKYFRFKPSPFTNRTFYFRHILFVFASHRVRSFIISSLKIDYNSIKGIFIITYSFGIHIFYS